MKTHEEIDGWTFYSNFSSGFVDSPEDTIPANEQTISEKIREAYPVIPIEAIKIIRNTTMGFGWSAYVANEFSYCADSLRDKVMFLLKMHRELDKSGE